MFSHKLPQLVKSLTKKLYDEVKLKAETHAIDPGLIYAKSHIQAYLVRDEKNFLKGWRKEVLGDTFQKTISN